VETSINHRGKSLALLLISYAICYLKQIHSNTRYVLLDDCSDNSHKIEKNLYHKLGFVPRDHTALSMYDSTELKLCGPEKQLLIDKGFLQKARDVNSLEQRRNLSHRSQLMSKARRSLKSAALEQQEKERERTRQARRSQLMSKARRSLKSAALEQQEKERERTKRARRSQLMTKARKSLKSAALEQAGKKKRYPKLHSRKKKVTRL
jgi:hypothetical protein